MAALGVNVDQTGRHSPEWVRETGATAVRIVLQRQFDLRDRFRDYRDHGIFILGVCARESFDDFGSWGEAFSSYLRRYGEYLGAVQVGNESDLESPSSWTMTPAALSTLGWTARYAMPNMPLVCAGMASGQAWWLGSVDLRWCNAIAVHPYAKDMTRSNDLTDADALIEQYRAYGLPIWVSEWGWWGDEWRGESEVRDMVTWARDSDAVERYFHFCLDDAMVAPFGLYRADGSEKPAARAFREVAGQPKPEPTPDVGWIGDGLQRELDRLGWTPTTGEHDETLRLVRAKTLVEEDGIVVWDNEAGVARSYVSTEIR